MKSSIFTLLTTTVAAVLAAPAQQTPNLNAIDANRAFSCPPNVQDFCSASNIHSGCTFGGNFVTDAEDTCGSCTC